MANTGNFSIARTISKYFHYQYVWSHLVPIADDVLLYSLRLDLHILLYFPDSVSSNMPFDYVKELAFYICHILDLVLKCFASLCVQFSAITRRSGRCEVSSAKYVKWAIFQPYLDRTKV